MSRIIAIDAGHGHNTPGKRCLKKLDPKETREHDLNDRVADLVEERMKKYDCTILRTDDTTGLQDISLANRVKAANAAGADLFLSIHHNAGAGGKESGGTVVYYDSSRAERTVQAIYLYREVVGHTGLKGDRSTPVVRHGFYVLKKTKAPAFLLENGFMDSSRDVPVILTEEHAQKTAEGIEKFLVFVLGLKVRNTEDNSETAPDPNLEPNPNQNQSQNPNQNSTIGSRADRSVYYPAYTGPKTTLVCAMKSMGFDSAYRFRKKIALANGINGYRGSAAQNTRLYNLLTAGLLRRIKS